MKKRRYCILPLLISIIICSCSSNSDVPEQSSYSPNYYFPLNGILEFKNLNANQIELKTKKIIESINHELLIEDSSNIINWIHDSLIKGNITRAPNMVGNWQYYNEDKSIQLAVHFCDNEILELGKELKTDTISNQFQRSAVITSSFGNLQEITKFNSMFKHVCISNLLIKITIIEKSIFGNKVKKFDSKPIADTASLYTFVGPEILTFLDKRK